MTEQPTAPDNGKGTDIDAADLDVAKEVAPEDLPATSDEREYVEDGETLGGTGGRNAGGAG
ncbi:MAG: hypothetical protein JWN35_3892 [Frankiales bacterium]|jgi:hypothetical protein|nr:hypothetical protein [Frankiales bacterium]